MNGKVRGEVVNIFSIFMVLEIVKHGKDKNIFAINK